MAHFDTTRPMADGHSALARLTGFFSRVAAAVSAWNDARITRKALSSLSDHELDDLGLSRGDIDTLAFNGRR